MIDLAVPAEYPRCDPPPLTPDGPAPEHATRVDDGSRAETTVLVVDDHQCFADLLSLSLDTAPGVRCVGTARSAGEGIEAVASLRPDVLVMDIEMPGINGLVATRRLRTDFPGMAIVVISAHSGAEWLARAARAGASGFVGKGGSLAELVDTVRGAKPGTLFRPTGVPVIDQLGHQAPGLYNSLTARERQVLDLLVQGLPNKSIAKILGISVHTCRGYVKSIYLSLNVSGRIDALNAARRLHLVD